MKKFFSPYPIWQEPGLLLIRLIVGGFMIYHGWEVFDAEKMKPYMDWEVFKKFSSPSFIVYFGKSIELVAGVMLLLGLFTRLASIVLIITMIYIAFFIGSGKVWYEDQHPFMFVLLGFLFLIMGGGPYSLDASFFGKKSKT